VAGGRAAALSLCVQAVGGGLSGLAVQFSDESALEVRNTWYALYKSTFFLFKPPPPVGAGGGYMFSGRPSVRASVRASVIHVVVLCFRNISSIC